MFFDVLQAMGGDVAWTWMPSPLNAAAYMFADLITIESDVFSASKSMFNCVTLRPSNSTSTGMMRHLSEGPEKSIKRLSSISIH